MCFLLFRSCAIFVETLRNDLEFTFLLLFPFSPEDRVETPVATAMSREKEKYKTQEHGGLTVILDRPKAIWKVELEVGHCHLPRQDEGDGPGAKPQKDRQAAVKLKHASNPYLRQEPRVAAELGGDPSEPIENLHASDLQEQQTRRHPQKEECDFLCAIHVHVFPPDPCPLGDRHRYR
jgi:hypothetical protein